MVELYESTDCLEWPEIDPVCTLVHCSASQVWSTATLEWHAAADKLSSTLEVAKAYLQGDEIDAITAGVNLWTVDGLNEADNKLAAAIKARMA